MITIKEPEFLLLPAVAASKPNLMDILVKELDSRFAAYKDFFMEMAESCARASIINLFFGSLFPKSNKSSVYARRRVRKLVQMQKRRRK